MEELKDMGESAGGEELTSVEDIVDAIEGLDDGNAGEPQEGDSAPDAEEQPAQEETQGQEETGEQPAEEEQAPDVPLPQGMDAALWESASPALRNAIHEREKAHAQELGQAQQKFAQSRQEMAAFATAANGQIQQSLAIMRQVCEGEFAGINWQELSKSDPATYVQMQQLYQQRMGAIQGIQQNVARMAQAYEQQRAAEAKATLEAEVEAVRPEIKAMLGAGYGKDFPGEVARYMAAQGCPPEVINGLSRGYEMRLIVKAMLYDKLQERGAAARKKVAEAPKIQAPRGGKPGMDAGNERLQRARAMLNKNPDSTDALASVFEAL